MNRRWREVYFGKVLSSTRNSILLVKNLYHHKVALLSYCFHTNVDFPFFSPKLNFSEEVKNGKRD
ncbi:MAG: hypothetical protein ABIK99_00120 [candidate division WOR-3 bacterium]